MYSITFRTVRQISAVVTMLFAIASARSVNATVINVSNPENFLAGATVTTAVSGLNNGGAPFTGNPQTVTDNLAAGNDQDDDFIFSDNGTNDRLSLSNFGTKGGPVELRFFTAPVDGQRLPTAVTAYSSIAEQTSTNISDYSLLGSTPVSGPYTPYDPSEPTGNGRGYFDLFVTLPTGTQSLLINFTGSALGARIYEVQAVPVPEPSSIVAFLGMGAVGLLAEARRRRRSA